MKNACVKDSFFAAEWQKAVCARTENNLFMISLHMKIFLNASNKTHHKRFLTYKTVHFVTDLIIFETVHKPQITTRQLGLNWFPGGCKIKIVNKIKLFNKF